MSTADIAVIANAVVDLATVAAGWHLVKSGRVRLASPSVAQLQAEAGPQPDPAGTPAAVPQTGMPS